MSSNLSISFFIQNLKDMLETYEIYTTCLASNKVPMTHTLVVGKPCTLTPKARSKNLPKFVLNNSIQIKNLLN